MGFGDLSSAAHVYPALSTVEVDGASIGKHTAAALLARFAGKRDTALAGGRMDTGFSIIDRESA
jgi:LacI family gluconate utilization system Gnt-I transcriptional repressor